MIFGTEQSLTSHSTPTKKKAVVKFVQALAMESIKLIQVSAQVPLYRDYGEHLDLLFITLAEEILRALGEVDAEHAVNGHITQGVF